MRTLPSIDAPSKRCSRAARVCASIGSGLNADGGARARMMLGGGTASAMLGAGVPVGDDGKAKSETVSCSEGARRSCTSGAGGGKEANLRVECVPGRRGQCVRRRGGAGTYWSK